MTDLNALHFTPQHEWILIEGDVATIGITDYAAEQLGDVVFVELPEVDAGVTAGQVVGEIESTKSVGELFAPMDGDIVGVNQSVVDDPSLVNSAPFGDGWLIKVRVATSELPEGLLDRAGYAALTGQAL